MPIGLLDWPEVAGHRGLFPRRILLPESNAVPKIFDLVKLPTRRVDEPHNPRIPETQTCSLPLYLNEGERSSITELDNESSQKMTTLLIPGVGWDQKEVESK